MFDFNALNEHAALGDPIYSAKSRKAEIFKQTFQDLRDFLTVVNTHLSSRLIQVYKVRPTDQRGPSLIKHKDYVLLGVNFTQNLGNEIFLKFEFGSINSRPNFNLSLDIDFKSKSSFFRTKREEIYNDSYIEYNINEIPSDFEGLYSFIEKDLLKLLSKLNFYNTSYMNRDITGLLRFKKQIILQGPPGTGKTKLAKELAGTLTGLGSDEIKKSDQFEIIQFHPSYSYEDFVRGITAKPNPDGDGLIYEPENKLLANLAERALKNYRSVNTKSTKSGEGNYEEQLAAFITEIIDQIDQDAEGKYPLTENVYIYRVEENRVKYKGDNWTAHPNGLNMNFSELRKLLELNLRERSEITKNERLNSLTRQHATYFTKFLEKFDAFVKKNKKSVQANDPLKNYVLIIDEINRANLSSVLGELIYALEYREEGINSIYESQLTLPPNLFIIGTMNTADRSVSHIDYAIRRRFAFVPVLPKDLSTDPEVSFDGALFNEVERLFVNEDGTPSDHLSGEFEAKDVQLGHSYFIKKDSEGGSMEVRLKYEIQPILKEYVKDGILKQTAEAIIEGLQCSE